MSNTKTICFCNNKGGSGKTTTCGNLGYCLSEMNQRVLLIDGDMQLNLSLSFFNEKDVNAFSEDQNNLYYCLKYQRDIKKCIVNTQFHGLDLLPSSFRMSSVENDLAKSESGAFLLNGILSKIKKEGIYDYILLDSPPTLGSWVMNLVCASDKIIIPVEASPWGLFGLANMLQFLEQAKKSEAQLELMGILMTKVDERKKYYKIAMETIEEVGNVPVFSTKIPVDSMVEWAQDESRPVCEYKKFCKSAKEYHQFAKEVVSLWQ